MSSHLTALFKEVVALKEAIDNLEAQKTPLLARHADLLTQVQTEMRAQGIDDIRVRDMVFTRVTLKPRAAKKEKKNEKDVRAVLMRHVGPVDDPRVQAVLNDLKPAPVGPPQGEMREVLRQRKVKRVPDSNTNE
jgi:hypothetical protein